MLKNKLHDLRNYAAKTQYRMLIGLLGICFTLGLGLIWVFYGSYAAFLGLLCLTGGIVIILAILFILYIMERISKND